MAVTAEELDDDELQSRVLQETLEEVAAAHPEQEPDCCVICLDAISDPCEAVPCGHCNFDFICATNWFALHPSCPLCKARVSRVLHGARGVENRPVVKINDLVCNGPLSRAEEDAGNDPDTLTRRARRTRWSQWFAEERRRALGAPAAARESRPRGAEIQFRRQVYANGRFSMHVGSNRVSQYQELTPEMFRQDAHLVSRARMFIRRELQVFSFLSHEDPEFSGGGGSGAASPIHGEGPPSAAASTTAQPGVGTRHQREQRRANNAEFLLEYIVAILKSVDVMGSMGAARDMLSDFLGANSARLFLHELRSWLRSPYTRLEYWDRAVQYPGSAMPPAVDTEEPPREQRRPQRSRHQQGSSSSSRGARPRNQEPRQKADYYRPDGGNMQRWIQSSRRSVRNDPFDASDMYEFRQPDQRQQRHRP